MKVAIMSDLHGYLPELEPCDLVLICGDIIPLSRQNSFIETRKWFSTTFKKWAEELPCDKVIFIAGNHELYFPYHSETFGNMLFPKCSKVTYLCHEAYTYVDPSGKQYKIFGTPFCRSFGNWAFMLSDEELREKFNQIPNDLDILITHDQPYEFGDILLDTNCAWADGSHIGNISLRDAILAKQPKYQFNGHLHSCSHAPIKIGKTTHYNVSLKDENYNITYKPLYLEITK